MSVKQCKKCGEARVEADFELHKGYSRSTCRPCRTEARRIRRVFRRRVAREYVYLYLKAHPCSSCGEADPIVLQFDHVRGKKFSNISEMVCRGFPITRIEDEIAKCKVLCAYCHLRKTAEEQKWYSWERTLPKAV